MRRWWRAVEDLVDPRGRTSPARYRDRLLGIFGVWGLTGVAALWWDVISAVWLAWIWGVLCVMILVLRERRLHDTGHPGMGVRPFSPLECRERERRIGQVGEPHANRYGPVPRE